LDNCLAPCLARALNELGKRDNHQVVHLKQKFPENTPDDVWLPKLAGEGDWVIVSGDFKITTNPQNREALRASGLTTFILKKGWINHTPWEQAWRLVKWWPRIIAAAESIQQGLVYAVPVNPSSKLRPLGLR